MTIPIIHEDPWPLRVDADGVIRVGKGRLTLDTVIEAWREHLSPGEIAREFRQEPEDVYAAIAYYIRHRDELKPYLEQQAYAAYKLRDQIGAEQRPFPTRAELLKRLEAKHAEAGRCKDASCSPTTATP